MRTFEELKDAVHTASRTKDASSLMECADELDALATPEAEAVAHNARGAAFYLRGNYPAALEHYHSAIAMYEELGNRSGAATVNNGIGLVHQSTGTYPAALEHYHRALAMHQELGDSSGVAGVTCNIGNVHNSIGNYPAALEHLHRALALCEEIGHRHFAANITGNIGNVHYYTGNYPAAIEHYHRALAMHVEVGNNIGVASVTSSMLAVMIDSGEHAEAEALLQTMDAMHIDDPGVVISRELQRALLQEHHSNTDEARATLRAALRIAQEHSIAPKQADVHKALRDLAQQQNDFASYIEHNNEFARISEEINGRDTATKLAMQEKQREIDAKDREHQKHMAVLYSTLPKHIADRVARGEVVNDHFDNASVIFLDIVGFTELSSSMSSQDVITLLDTIFSQCDAICEQHNVTKIKTIGDSYMCVSFDSVVNAAHCALAMSRIKFSHEVSHNVSHVVSHEVLFRIGIHCGPVTAGVIGTQRMQYDVWGDTVNVASRMESTGEPGRIHVSQAFAENLEATLITRHSSLVTSSESLVTIDRGSIDVKGKGMMKTFWLENASA
jgi:adenylate cyclase